jgi:HK97 family phage major capsid protein
LIKESPIDIIQFYSDAITQQMAKLIDVHGLAGGGPFGTENLAAAATAAAGAHIQAYTGTIAAPTGLLAAYTNAFNAIEADDFAPSGWLVARPEKGKLRGLNDSTGRPLLAESFQSDVPDSLWGEPTYYLGRGVFPTGANALRAVVGDFSEYVIGIRDELTFSLHNEGTIWLDAATAATEVNLLQSNLTALRAEMRLGAKVMNNLAFARINQPAT